jgi:octaprenyl-diphosphate synthase
MVTILENPDFTGTDFAALVNMLERHGGIAYTREQAAAHIQRAKAKLTPFENVPTREILTDIADYALVRKA